MRFTLAETINNEIVTASKYRNLLLALSQKRFLAYTGPVVICFLFRNALAYYDKSVIAEAPKKFTTGTGESHSKRERRRTTRCLFYKTFGKLDWLTSLHYFQPSLTFKGKTGRAYLNRLE